MVSSSYSCCARPHATHGYPFLVFDCQGHLHLPLTVFTKEAQGRLASSSLKKYLTQILAFFSWLETDPWQVKANHRWTDEPTVRVEAEEEALNPVRHLLSGLKLFYRIAKAQNHYQHTNPLAGPFMEPLSAAREQLVKETDGVIRPKMPDQSGIDAPSRAGRLTDCYFLLLDKWVSQVVTDVTLPNIIRRGGQLLNEQRLKQGKRGTAWGLREECAVSLLFETGAHVSEILSLTLDDWNSRSLKDTAWARNKGSRKRYAKYIWFSQQTIKLLTRYFNTERRAVDPHHYTLDDYLRLAQRKEIDLKTVPLFLSQRGTSWTVESFRANYWKKACAAAKVDMDLHQCRHWYVNQALIEVHEQARKGKTTVERGEEELIAYMHWRSGEKVLKAYNHYYQPAHHAAVQNHVFKKLRSLPSKSFPTTQRRRRKQEVSQTPPVIPQEVTPESVPPQDGAALYAFLTGKGGATDGLIADLLATN